MKNSTKKWIGTKQFVFINTDVDGCAVTLTTAHHYAGNIIAPRYGFREMGVMVIAET